MSLQSTSREHRQARRTLSRGGSPASRQTSSSRSDPERRDTRPGRAEAGPAHVPRGSRSARSHGSPCSASDHARARACRAAVRDGCPGCPRSRQARGSAGSTGRRSWDPGGGRSSPGSSAARRWRGATCSPPTAGPGPRLPRDGRSAASAASQPRRISPADSHGRAGAIPTRWTTRRSALARSLTPRVAATTPAPASRCPRTVLRAVQGSPLGRREGGGPRCVASFTTGGKPGHDAGERETADQRPLERAVTAVRVEARQCSIQSRTNNVSKASAPHVEAIPASGQKRIRSDGNIRTSDPPQTGNGRRRLPSKSRRRPSDCQDSASPHAPPVGPYSGRNACRA